MSGRKYPSQCSNPVCRVPIEPDQPYSMELVQVLPAETVTPRTGQPFTYQPRRRWVLCGPACARVFLALCEVKNRVEAEAEAGVDR